jgi:hypothetical protein
MRTLKFSALLGLISIFIASTWALAQGTGYSGGGGGGGGGVTTLNGNVIGPAAANTVVQLQNVPVSDAGPTEGQFLVASDAGWAPTSLSGGINCSTTVPGLCYVDGGSVALSGDVTGQANANKVVGIETLPITGSGTAWQYLALNDAGTSWLYTSGFPYSSSILTSGTVAITASADPSTIVTSVSFTPKYTGKARVTCLTSVQATSNYGDTVNAAFSHGASPISDDVDMPGVSLFGPTNSSVQVAGVIEYGTSFSGSLAKFTVGSATQINCAVGSLGGNAQVLNNGAQIVVEELP